MLTRPVKPTPGIMPRRSQTADSLHETDERGVESSVQIAGAMFRRRERSLAVGVVNARRGGAVSSVEQSPSNSTADRRTTWKSADRASIIATRRCRSPVTRHQHRGRDSTSGDKRHCRTAERHQRANMMVVNRKVSEDNCLHGFTQRVSHACGGITARGRDLPGASRGAHERALQAPIAELNTGTHEPAIISAGAPAPKNNALPHRDPAHQRQQPRNNEEAVTGRPSSAPPSAEVRSDQAAARLARIAMEKSATRVLTRVTTRQRLQSARPAEAS